MIARLKLFFALIAGAALGACGGEQTPTETASDPDAEIAETSPAIAADDLRRHVEILSSDAFEGRAPMTPGGQMTRDYIAQEYARIGLEPVDGSYFQEVPMVEATLDPDRSFLRVSSAEGARALAYKSEAVYWTKRATGRVDFDDSDMIFVGYGIVAPEYGWDDYAGVDARGKTVVMLINDPGFATEDPALFNGRAMTYYGRWTYKYEEAARQGAAAAIIIHKDAPAAYGWNVVEGSWSGPQVDLQRADEGAGRVALEGWITYETAEELMTLAGLDLSRMEEAAKTAGFTATPMQGLSASGRIVQSLNRSADANVIGVLPGTEAPDEYVLYTAHWDHLGVNPEADGDDKIFNGAVDNATGVAAILEIAEAFAADRPRRSVMFAAVTAEESGLLGSAHLAANPVVPLKQIVAGVNIDAILPAPPASDIIVVGYGASELEDVLQQVAAGYSRRIQPDPEPEKGYYYRSDHISLAKEGVPMLYADSGLDLIEGGAEAGQAFADDYTANRYHSPADEYDESWDFSGMTETVQILYETGAMIARSSAWPTWYEDSEFRAIRDAQRAEG